MPKVLITILKLPRVIKLMGSSRRWITGLRKNSKIARIKDTLIIVMA
jgi:hypothetical protein